MLKLFGDKQEKVVSPVADPFNSRNVASIHIHCHPRYGSTEWRASIDFVNGNTEGTQKFSNKDFSALLQEMKACIDSLTK